MRWCGTPEKDREPKTLRGFLSQWPNITVADLARFEYEENFGRDVQLCQRAYYQARWPDLVEIVLRKAQEPEQPQDEKLRWLEAYAVMVQIPGFRAGDLVGVIGAKK